MLKSFQYCFLVFLLLTKTVCALEAVSIAVEQIESADWQLKGISLSLANIAQEKQQLNLSIDQLLLSEPFPQLTFFDIQCTAFRWQQQRVHCQKGKAKLKSSQFKSSTFDFSFLIKEGHSLFNIMNLKLAKGILSIRLEKQDNIWNVDVKAKGIEPKILQTFLPIKNNVDLQISQGKIALEGQLSGDKNGLTSLQMETVLTDLTLQAKDGQVATELLNIDLQFQIEKSANEWLWRHKNQVKSGEVYLDPVYLTIKNQALQIESKGRLTRDNRLQVQQFSYQHSGVFELNAEGEMSQSPEWTVDRGNVNVDVNNLQSFYKQYLSPFSSQASANELSFKGGLNAIVELEQNKPRAGKLKIEGLSIEDSKNRFSIVDGYGVLNWSIDPNFSIISELNWQQLKVKGLPIDQGEIEFLAKSHSISVIKPMVIALLGGSFDIHHFDWEYTKDEEPTVYFEGRIRHISLERLTTAMQWTPLSGNISGEIPTVVYKNKTLTINGDLMVKLFDGTIKISKLASSGMFRDFSRFYMDMEVDNLDLHAITQKFKMGGIEGRLSGYINNLYLENWQPVSFYAWLGTPENDQSKHRISQKAVENIASIGGGGAADVISKGFLRFFDTFGYDKLGFGCYLNQGVCQLMGVEAAEQGYYIIKGGGLPRIDVIAYNPRLDWNILMERLSRIIDTDEVVIE